MSGFLLGASLLVALSLWLALRRLAAEQRRAALLLGTGLVVVAAGAYAALGQPAAWEAAATAAAPPEAVGPAQIQAMVARLAERLRREPDDAKGWRMLARSYENLNRFEEASAAYEQLLRLTPRDADMLTDYAVTLALSQRSETLVGAPERLIQQALAAAPEHLQARALAGSVAFEKQDYANAVKHWRHVLAAAPPGSELAHSIEQNIVRAEQARR